LCSAIVLDADPLGGLLHFTLTPTGWASEVLHSDGTVVDRVGAGCA
jgi:hypothetical protein